MKAPRNGLYYVHVIELVWRQPAPPRVGVSTADRNYLPSLVFCVVRSVAARPLRARRSLLFASTSQPNTPPPGERLGRGRPPPRRLTLSSGPFFRRAPRRTERDGLATRGSGHNFSSAQARAPSSARKCGSTRRQTMRHAEAKCREIRRPGTPGDQINGTSGADKEDARQAKLLACPRETHSQTDTRLTLTRLERRERAVSRT